MERIYETTTVIDGKVTTQDFYYEAHARGEVERAGAGRVVLFIRDFDKRDRSAKMDVFENGAWRGVNISTW